MRPYIGVTCSAEPDGTPVVRPAYVRAVHAAGGLPAPLPFLASLEEAHQLLERLNGVLLTGSEDLDAALWNEPLHPAAKVMHPNRQRTEVLLCQALLERDLPTLAICGGMQTLAVVAGGSIHQHLPDLGQDILDHSVGADGPRHAVQAQAGSLLAGLLGQELSVNSAHHQGVDRLGDGMLATAHCSDGVLEAYEMPERRLVLGVQWHPERMPGEGAQERLFESLVASAAG